MTMFPGAFCTECGKRRRSANHLCQPSAIRAYEAAKRARAPPEPAPRPGQ